MIIGFFIGTLILCFLLFMANVNYYHKIQNTVDAILSYGDIDGSHHKQWVLSQILGILVSEKYYKELVNNGFDEGIAP